MLSSFVFLQYHGNFLLVDNSFSWTTCVLRLLVKTNQVLKPHTFGSLSLCSSEIKHRWPKNDSHTALMPLNV